MEREPESNESPDDRKALPELTQAVLDPELLERYFDDLTRCVEVLGILPKQAAREYAGSTEGWGLAEAREAVRTGRIRGVQIRYLYQDAEWWDTLLCPQPGSVRIVRMRQGASS